MNIAAVCLASWIGVGSAAHSVNYEIAGKWPIGGDGGWDYPSVDSAASLLYLSRSGHVIVVDLRAGKTIGDIGDTPGVHGIAIAADLNRGYISAGNADQVKVFDLKTRETIASIAVGSNPDAILYEPVTRQIFAFNGRSGSASVIDASSDKIVGTIALAGKPEFARADGRGLVFVNIEDKNVLAVIDAKKLSVFALWNLPTCDGPTGLALDAAHRRSFSVCSNAIMAILDTNTGRAVATLPIGKGVDGVEFDAATQDAFSANGEGTLTIVHEGDPEHFAVAQTLITNKGARTIALDAKTHILYLPGADFGEANPSASDPHPRAPILPDSFFVLAVAPVPDVKPR